MGGVNIEPSETNEWERQNLVKGSRTHEFHAKWHRNRVGQVEEGGERFWGMPISSHPQAHISEDINLKFNLCSELILLGFRKNLLPCSLDRPAKSLRPNQSQFGHWNTTWKELFATQIHFFQVYVSFGPGRGEGMFYSENKGLKRNNINRNDVYSVLLTILVSETQMLEWSLSLNCSVCEMVCHRAPSSKEFLGAFCSGHLLPRCSWQQFWVQESFTGRNA